MIEAWLAAGFFGLLVLMWVVLPSRLVRRERAETPPQVGARAGRGSPGA